MRYRPFPGTPLVLSVICLGTGGYGTNIPTDQAYALLDAYAEQGGTFLDTARIYGAWAPGGDGASEKTLGAWLQSRGVREKFVISTKGAHPDLATMHISRIAPADIAADIVASLDALRTDYLDIYWLHRDDPRVPVREILAALNEHLAAGRIRALGASNWELLRLVEANAYAASHGLTGFQANQIGYSLADANTATAPVAGMLYMDGATYAYQRHSGLPVMAYSSQALGFFSGKYHRAQMGQAESGVARLYFTAANFDRLERAQEIARRHGCTANQVNLAYLMAQPFAVYPIVGCRTVEQVADSCAAAHVELSAGEISYLVGE
jgi:aryl-alcohol dehydrogenase-like predicted oxidoreductase